MIKLRYALFVVLVLLIFTFGNNVNADTDSDCFASAYILNVIEQVTEISQDIDYLMENGGSSSNLTMELYLYKYGLHLADTEVLNDCLMPIHSILSEYYENTIIMMAMMSTIGPNVDQEAFVDTFLLFQAKREDIEERFLETLGNYND